ncbi:hypothetical protein T484DRAFT_1798137 [Baffinella frigidus]|nr:hypothetical protein T484DRAFT_1798137 [Cryptophyta sp. CCMP2293]
MRRACAALTLDVSQYIINLSPRKQVGVPGGLEAAGTPVGESPSRRTTALGRALESGHRTPGTGRMVSDGAGGLTRQGEVILATGTRRDRDGLLSEIRMCLESRAPPASTQQVFLDLALACGDVNPLLPLCPLVLCILDRQINKSFAPTASGRSSPGSVTDRSDAEDEEEEAAAAFKGEDDDDDDAEPIPLEAGFGAKRERIGGRKG